MLASPPSPAVRFLEDRLSDGGARMMAIPYLVGHPISPMLFGLADFRGFSALAVRRYSDYVRLLSPGADLTVQEIWSPKSPLLDLAAVRYVVLPDLTSAKDLGPEALLLAVPKRPAPDDPDLPVAYADDWVVVHESRGALPRLRIAHRAVPLADESTARQWAAGWSRKRDAPAADRDAVAVEPDERGNPAPSVSGDGSANERARLIATADPDRVRIETRLDSPGLVVLADTYYPGWTATVDGAPAPIYPADLMFRAVHVGAGEHAIEMRYQPRSLRVGMIAAALALVLCVLAVFNVPLRASRLKPHERVS